MYVCIAMVFCWCYFSIAGSLVVDICVFFLLLPFVCLLLLLFYCFLNVSLYPNNFPNPCVLFVQCVEMKEELFTRIQDDLISFPKQSTFFLLPSFLFFILSLFFWNASIHWILKRNVCTHIQFSRYYWVKLFSWLQSRIMFKCSFFVSNFRPSNTACNKFCTHRIMCRFCIRQKCARCINI